MKNLFQIIDHNHDEEWLAGNQGALYIGKQAALYIGEEWREIGRKSKEDKVATQSISWVERNNTHLPGKSPERY